MASEIWWFPADKKLQWCRMRVMVPQITGNSTVCSKPFSSWYQSKYQRKALLAFVKGIHRWPVDSPHKGPVMWESFSSHDVIMWYKPMRWNITAPPPTQGSSMVQAMTRCLVCAKPLSELKLLYFQISLSGTKLWQNLWHTKFFIKEMTFWKCHLRNGSQFVQSSNMLWQFGNTKQRDEHLMSVIFIFFYPFTKILIP